MTAVNNQKLNPFQIQDIYGNERYTVFPHSVPDN